MWKVVSLFVVFVALAAEIIAAEEKIPVNVYYETLCPDSIAFVTKQVVPTHNTRLKNYMNLKLVPYGKATHQRSADGHNWEFKCHHGPVECYGNKVQGCILKHVQEEDDQLKYINCLLTQAKTLKNEYPLNKCLSGGDLSTVTTCANGTYPSAQGADILAKNGDETHKLNPPLTSVPTVVFDGEFNKTVQDLAQKDFRHVLCSYIKDKPQECNSAASLTLSSLAAILSFISLRYL